VADFPTIDRVASALAGRTEPDGDAVVAAVMVCLRDRNGPVEVLLGRRSERSGDPWSGHIGLPGGRLASPDEPPLEAAVRETIEEVGFDPTEHGRLLGPLPRVHGRASEVLVASFAAQITTDVEPVPSDELQAAWWAPLAEYREATVRVPEVPFPVPALVGPGGDGREAVVWGMTYRLLESVRELAS
jgi:8-oxo-dGTP pyrophosphatase MutT (NUDIX family)